MFTGSAAYPVSRFSSPSRTSRGVTRTPAAWLTTTAPMFATAALRVDRNTRSGPPRAGCRLRLDGRGPRDGTAAGIDDVQLLGRGRAALHEPEREPARIREDERRIGAREVDASASFAQRRDLCGRGRGMHGIAGRLER